MEAYVIGVSIYLDHNHLDLVRDPCRWRFSLYITISSSQIRQLICLAYMLFSGARLPGLVQVWNVWCSVSFWVTQLSVACWTTGWNYPGRADEEEASCVFLETCSTLSCFVFHFLLSLLKAEQKDLWLVAKISTVTVYTRIKWQALTVPHKAIS